ncbi:MAG: O-acetyl-ADP-ribose deacetylase [Gammaproteobacteria bacterium]
MTIEVVQGDITGLHVDVIVNAANQSLLGGGGVDGAIHRAAGPELKAYNRKLGGCPTGEGRVSPGFALPAKWIVHTVGPVWRGGEHGESRLLDSCYRNAFELAMEKGAESIAFPAISTGVYGYPKQQAAQIAVAAMRDYERHFKRVVACCYDPDDGALYRQMLGSAPEK